MFSPNEKFYRHDQASVSDALGIKRADLGMETKDLIMNESSISASIAGAIRTASNIEEACYMSFLIGSVQDAARLTFFKGIAVGAAVVIAVFSVWVVFF